MATDDAENAGVSETPESSGADATATAVVGDYTWADFMTEYGHEAEVSALYGDKEDGAEVGSDPIQANGQPIEAAWDRVDFSPDDYLGFQPEATGTRISQAVTRGAGLQEHVFRNSSAELTPVSTRFYTWEDYKQEFFYKNGEPPTQSGEPVEFDPSENLGFDPDETEAVLSAIGTRAAALDDVIDKRTVDVNEEFDEDAFFSDVDGRPTVTNRYDLEKAVPFEKKRHFEEIERYWVNKPYAFVIIFKSRKENETKYYLIEPYLTSIETDLRNFLSEKLRTAIKYSSDDVLVEGEDEDRAAVIERVMYRLLRRYDLINPADEGGSLSALFSRFDETPILRELAQRFGESDDQEDETEPFEGIAVRPEPKIVEEDDDTLSEYQVEKLAYLLKRDFVGYERIDGIKHDINVEDISCDGYNSPVFVYHTDYEQLISNVYHGQERLDDFVVKLAQRSGKGISKRQPQVDATLPDGSRAQLTLGAEVSDHGTNYTIRQFKDVPFTPIDLINWHTFSLDQMAYLWLAIENHKSLIFAGGTASGKTTSLNAVSLFIPSNAKIVSIEDTREVELPQRNWIASVTRPSFSQDDQGDIDEFDLLEAALRQRPDYIVMGEIRGEEGRTLFQVMSTGHTTYTTFHADTVGEVLKRFTTEPINVSKTLFTALDLVSIQTQTRVQGRKVRKSKSITEINHYDAENDEINVQDVYQWRAESDEFLEVGQSSTLDEIMFDRGWSYERLQEELFKRRVILAYLIRNELNEYAQVAATVQAFINDPDTLLALIANDALAESLDDLREMESVHIDIDPEKESLVPRPDPTDHVYELTGRILEQAEERLFDEYRGLDLDGEDLLAAIEPLRRAGSESEPAPTPAEDDLSAADATKSATEHTAVDQSSVNDIDGWINDGATDEGTTANASAETENRGGSMPKPAPGEGRGRPAGAESVEGGRSAAESAESTAENSATGQSSGSKPIDTADGSVADTPNPQQSGGLDDSGGNADRPHGSEGTSEVDPVNNPKKEAGRNRSPTPEPDRGQPDIGDESEEWDEDIVAAFDEAGGDAEPLFGDAEGNRGGSTADDADRDRPQPDDGQSNFNELAEESEHPFENWTSQTDDDFGDETGFVAPDELADGVETVEDIEDPNDGDDEG